MRKVGPVLRDDATDTFFDGTSKQEYLLRKCPEGHYSEPVSYQCTRCASVDLQWAPAAGGAKVVSWAIVHGRTSEGRISRTPVVIAELDEGPWVWTKVIDAELDDVFTGVRLQLAYEDFDEDHETVPVFRLTV